MNTERKRVYMREYMKTYVLSPEQAAAKRAYQLLPENMERNRQQLKDKYRTRAALINAIKDVPCTDCGQRYPNYVMHFDHRDPTTKLFAIGKGWSKSWDKVLAEIEKCELVCANCHAERTWGAQEA